MLLSATSCSVDWTQAIQQGTSPQNDFNNSVPFTIKNNLIFVPISINGKQYQFLFDTGAPLSISKQLQDEHQFKIISKGTIKDSNHNKKKVKWSRLNAIKIGEATFTNQTAFVGDFEANPILKCLKIDGIIGSNLIRQANWVINQENKTLSFSSNLKGPLLKNSIKIPFKTDQQYNIYIDLSIGRLNLKNVLVDFGSNGSVALSETIFNQLKEENIITSSFDEHGVTNTGIVGKPVELKRQICWTDSVRFNETRINDVKLKTGKTVSIGNKLLARYEVVIDWNNRYLYLNKVKEHVYSRKTFGINIGYTDLKGVYVQSVIENSSAFKQGIKPHFKVLQIDDLDFNFSMSNFCDYVNYQVGDSLNLRVINNKGDTIEVKIDKTLL